MSKESDGLTEAELRELAEKGAAELGRRQCQRLVALD